MKGFQMLYNNVMVCLTNKNGNFAVKDQQIRETIQLFEDDLPHPELLQQEIFHWKTFWINNKKNYLKRQ